MAGSVSEQDSSGRRGASWEREERERECYLDLLSRSAEAWEEGRVEEALRLGEEAVSLRPADSVGLEALAEMYLAEGRPEAEVNELYLKAAEYEPGLTWALAASLANLWEAYGEPEQAEMAMRKGVEMAPEEPLVWVGLAEHLTERGRVTEAVAQLEAAPPQLRGTPAFLACLGRTLALSGRYGYALRMLAGAPAANPTEGELAAALAVVRQGEEAHRQAAAGLEAAVLDPAQAGAIAEHIRTCELCRCLGEAKRSFFRAVAGGSVPGTDWPLLQLGALAAGLVRVLGRSAWGQATLGAGALPGGVCVLTVPGGAAVPLQIEAERTESGWRVAFAPLPGEAPAIPDTARVMVSMRTDHGLYPIGLAVWEERTVFLPARALGEEVPVSQLEWTLSESDSLLLV